MDLQPRVEELLGLGGAPPSKARKTEFGVSSYELENNDGSQWRVLAIDEEEVDSESLEESAALAAFYNAKFFHEIVSANRGGGLHVPPLIASFKKANYAVFVVEDAQSKGERLIELGMDELTQVAEQLAHLHALRMSQQSEEDVQRTINDNHEVVRELASSRIEKSLEMAAEAIENELSGYFKNPLSVRKKLLTVFNSSTSPSLSISPRLSVLCHGDLTYEKCTFDSKGKLIEINDWENVHSGHPAEDLASLIISSAEASIRRKYYMKIIRHYFYTLVDLRAPQLMLADLRSAFKRAHRDVVLRQFDSLIDSLSCPVFDDGAKRIISRRWESALDDAYEIATGESYSDNEQCFFK